MRYVAVEALRPLLVGRVYEGELLKVGMIGAAIAAICCFTPALVVLPGALGLSRLAGMVDNMLLPALRFFAGLIVYALTGKSRAAPERSESP
jgi:mercuric ion transport protein